MVKNKMQTRVNKNYFKQQAHKTAKIAGIKCI